MKYQVDQSIRIEETGNSMIGIANTKESFVLCIPTKTKNSLREYFRKRGFTKQYMIFNFSAGVILAITRSKFKVSELVVDIEYPGYEQEITKYINNYFRGKFDIYFSLVGKKSAAHFAAYGAHIGKRRVDFRAKASELLSA